jgi:hypothetical protein
MWSPLEVSPGVLDRLAERGGRRMVRHLAYRFAGSAVRATNDDYPAGAAENRRMPVASLMLP